MVICILAISQIIQAPLTATTYRIRDANKALDLFLMYNDVLKTIQKKYNGYSHIQDITLSCSEITMVDYEEPSLSPINLIILSTIVDLEYLVDMGQHRITETDLNMGDIRFEENMRSVAMFLSMIYNIENMPPIKISSTIQDTKNYIKLKQTQNHNKPLQMFACLALLTRVELNDALFTYYLRALRQVTAIAYAAGITSQEEGSTAVAAKENEKALKFMVSQIDLIKYKEPQYETSMVDLIGNQLTQGDVTKIVDQVPALSMKRIKPLAITGIVLIVVLLFVGNNF